MSNAFRRRLVLSDTPYALVSNRLSSVALNNQHHTAVHNYNYYLAVYRPLTDKCCVQATFKR